MLWYVTLIKRYLNLYCYILYLVLPSLVLLQYCTLFYYCNVYVKRTRPNAVDQLGWTTYRATLRFDLLTHTSSFTFTCGYIGADATSSPPFTLATAHPRLQPAQGSASTTLTSCRARHCNVYVKRTRPNAVDRLGWTTYRANQLIRLVFHLLLRWSWRYIIPFPLRRRRHSIVSNQRKGVHPPLQRPGVLAIVTFMSKGRVPMRSTGSVEQPIELLDRFDLLIHTSSFTFTCGYVGADATLPTSHSYFG